jgi:hypothetical protein
MDRIQAMFMLSPQLKKSFCLTLVAILLWIGGLGCALCCATREAEACCAQETAATHMLSPDDSEHGCCQTSQSSDNSSHDAVSKGASLKGCVLLPRRENSLAVIQQVACDEAIAPASGESLLLSNTARGIKTAANNPSPPGRSDTYLRCCVLLI